MRKLFIFILFLTFHLSAYCQVNDKLPTLLVFSGSDWCSNCIRFNKEVLTDSGFVNYTKDRFVVYKADFPQRKKLPEETIQRNETLAEQFNPQGYFPKIVLLNNKQELISAIPYSKQSAADFIAQIDQLLPELATKEYKKRIPAMGSFFEFILVDSVINEARAWATIDLCIQEVKRIERLISEWIPTSEISMVNKMAGVEPVKISPELYRLIERSIQTGNLTQGAFDITFQALSGLWKFDGTQKVPPDSARINKALQKVGFQIIQLLDTGKVFLPIEGMAIGFGGIGQGYAVDMVKNLLINKGFANFVVNSSGDIFAAGKKADGSSWKIGIADPFNKNRMIRWLEMDGKAVVTSGNYEKYFEYEGVRYAHILNPKTGWPTQGIVSTTIISPYTEVADALATALFVLGVDLGLDLINQLPQTECIIIDDKKNVHYSRELIIKN